MQDAMTAACKSLLIYTCCWSQTSYFLLCTISRYDCTDLATVRLIKPAEADASRNIGVRSSVDRFNRRLTDCLY